jgi:hypothetical protein
MLCDLYFSVTKLLFNERIYSTGKKIDQKRNQANDL